MTTTTETKGLAIRVEVLMSLKVTSLVGAIELSQANDLLALEKKLD